MKINKKRIAKKLKKINLLTIFFFIMSLISSTFAWFAFSNIVNNDMEIDVKSWKVNISDENGELSNQLNLNIKSFYPGSEPTKKTITITNDGDLPSKLTFNISYLRIFDNELDVSNQEVLLDKISQEYPFQINFYISNEYIEDKSDSVFQYSINWPLDSGNDIDDTTWGMRANDFITSENKKKSENPSYTIRKGIEIIVDLSVEQYVGDFKDIKDENYLLGNEYFFDRTTLNNCSEGSDNCYRYYVIDTNNLVNDEYVNYMIEPISINNKVAYSDISSNNINTNQIFNIISKDIFDTNIVINNLSNKILGNINNIDNYNNVLNRIISTNGTIEFSKNVFNFLKSNECYWVYDEVYNNLAIKNKDENTIMLYKETTNNCKSIEFISKQK